MYSKIVMILTVIIPLKNRVDTVIKCRTTNMEATNKAITKANRT